MKPPKKRSPASSPRSTRPALPGAHRVPRRGADGWCTHWYAWRGEGAPKIGEYHGATRTDCDAAAVADVVRLTAAYGEARGHGSPQGVRTLADLAKAYEKSGEFQSLAASTQWEWSRKLLAIARSPLHDLSLRALEAKGARALFLKWRDTMAATPRKADFHIQVLSRVLSWGVTREYLARNVLIGAGTIYRADRAKVIWSEGEVARLCAAGTPEFALAVRFLRLTGFRRADAVRVTWSAVDEERGAIVWRTSKSRRQTEHVAEITPELRALLDDIPRVGPVMLTSSRGRPWSVEGLTGSFDDARKAAQIDPGPDGKPKRLHDLRGTSATAKVAALLESDEVRRAHGWSKGERGAASAYVDAATVVALKRRRRDEGAI